MLNRLCFVVNDFFSIKFSLKYNGNNEICLNLIKNCKLMCFFLNFKLLNNVIFDIFEVLKL